MKISPCSPFFHSQIPRGLLRKLRENRAGNCNPLGTDSHLDPWERRPLSGGISRRQHRAGSLCVTGSTEQTSNATALEGEPKQTISERKRVWLSWGSPIQHTGTKAFHRACRCCRAEERRTGGDEGWKIKQSKRKPEKGWGERWEWPESRVTVPSRSILLVGQGAFPWVPHGL